VKPKILMALLVTSLVLNATSLVLRIRTHQLLTRATHSGPSEWTLSILEEAHRTGCDKELADLLAAYSVAKQMAPQCHSFVLIANPEMDNSTNRSPAVKGLRL
jgi:hypothetical protein